MEELIALLRALAPLSPKLLARLRKIIKVRVYKKDDYILREGEMCDSIFYIQSGLVMSYYMVNGKQVPNWFMKNGDIVIDILSFLQEKPSKNTQIALKDCICYGISRKALYQLYKQYPQFNKHRAIILEDYYCKSEQRNMDNKQLTPLQRYEMLMEKSPDLISNVAIKYLASYLNMSKRMFSTARKEYQQIQQKKLKAARKPLKKK